MFDSSRRKGRLFYWIAVAALGICMGVPLAHAATPAKTMIADTMYRADGTPAQGTLLIRWPAFTASDGSAVAAGTMSMAIGADGWVEIPLIANTGSNPEGTFYRVTLKLDDGTTSEEYWVVPQVETTTVGAVRSTLVPLTVAQQFVGRDYVDTKFAQVSSSTSVVHTSGDETIDGQKQFSSSPLVPDPVDGQAAASKSYVDTRMVTATDAVHLTGDETVSGNKTFTGEVDAQMVTLGVNAVTYSATPAFDGAKGNIQRLVLTGNVASASLMNVKTGQRLTFVVCQDETGGRAFEWPSNVRGGAVLGGEANKCSTQEFVYDGTTAYAVTPAIINQ